jgi:hypothetical protein
MDIVENLLDTAVKDNGLLIAMQQNGDVPNKPRDLEFFLYAQTEERATLVADFITDNRYGRPLVQFSSGDKPWLLKVTVNSPATENVIHALSAFFVFLSEIYDLEYDGWETSIER